MKWLPGGPCQGPRLSLISWAINISIHVDLWLYYSGLFCRMFADWLSFPLILSVAQCTLPPLSLQAEVVAFEDFKALATGKSMAEVKAAGKYRQEGKTYVMVDGDIVHFQFK